MTQRGGAWVTQDLLGSERGQTWDAWTYRIDSGAGSFAKPTIADQKWDAIGWKNNAATSRGTAEYHRAYGDMGFEGETVGGTVYTASHVVHLRVPDKSNASADIAIGPATAIHSGGAGNAGNCYFAQAIQPNSLRIGKMRAGAETTFTTATGVPVREGDVVSLGYRYTAAAGGSVSLFAYVNGAQKTTAVDTVLIFDMATLAARPGIWGDDSPSLANTLSVGHWTTEWWITSLIGSAAEEIGEAFRQLAGQLYVSIMGRQRYTDSPAPTIKHLISGEIVKAEWSWRRNGGCDHARIQFRLQDKEQSTTLHASERSFEDPPYSDWDGNNWHGGDVVIAVKYDARDIETLVDHRLWRGRVAEIAYEPSTRIIELEAEGLVAHFEEWWFSHAWANIPIRQVFVDIIKATAKGPASESNRDTFVRFNDSKITGVQSVLDQPITMEFKGETVSSAIQRVMRFLPDGFTWGVDEDGDFYLTQQAEVYDENAAGLTIQHYSADRARSWKRRVDFSQIVNTVEVWGAEDKSQPVGFVTGVASCEKSRALFGHRGKILQESELQDPGIAAKMAAATVRRTCAPALAFDLEVVEPISGERSFWESLTPQAAQVAVNDRWNRTAIQNLPSSKYEHQMRLFGDEKPTAPRDDGNVGGLIELASVAAERALADGWLYHVNLRFDTAHPGPVNTWVFVCGRPSSTADKKGWGGLHWNNQNNALEWWYEDSGGTQRFFSTGITVPAGAPADQIVKLTIWRVGRTAGSYTVGDWAAFNGGTRTALVTTLRASPPAIGKTESWRFFVAPFAGSYGWGGVPDQWWIADTLSGTAGLEYHATSGLGVENFIARNNSRSLGRHEAEGLLLHAKFNDAFAQPVPLTTYNLKVWRPGGTAYNALWTAGTNAAAGTQITTQRQGQLLGQEKRWGGPLVLNANAVTYEVLPEESLVVKRFDLGDLPRNGPTLLAGIEEEAKRQKELLQRVATGTA